MARASSVRPEPTSPAMPTISPLRTENEMSSSTTARGSCGAAARHARDLEDDRARRARRQRREQFAAARPTIMRMMRSMVSSATAALPTTLPSRSTVTRSQISSTSRAGGSRRWCRCLRAAGRARCSNSASHSLGERRRRLVHDDEARAHGQRAGDLDHLLPGDRQIAHLLQLSGRSRPRRATTGGAAMAGQVTNGATALAAEKQFSSTVIGHEVELLVDRDDAQRSGPPGVEASVTVCPRTRWFPRRGSSAPEKIFSSVDFPAPFSPSRPWTSPSATSSATPSSAWTPGNCRETPVTRKQRAGHRLSVSGEWGGRRLAPGRRVRLLHLAKPLRLVEIVLGDGNRRQEDEFSSGSLPS